MKTTNAMQLKAIVKKMSDEMGVSSQLVLQNYLLECLLKRVSVSPYRDKVIIKGGVLIGSLIGIDKRTTMDLDTTIKGLSLTHETAKKVFGEICAIKNEDNIDFELLRAEDIREVDDYPGIRIFLKANYPPMSVSVVVNITTGDIITPHAIKYSYPLSFDDGFISLMTYPIETILAEKLETVLSRGITNTRSRDYYDIYMLWSTQGNKCTVETLRSAFEATSEKRGSLNATKDYKSIITAVLADDKMNTQWKSYTKRFSYAREINFEDTCDSVLEIMKQLSS